MRYLPLLLLLSVPVWAQGRRPIPSEKPYTTILSEDFHFRSFEDDHGGFYLLWSADQSTGVVIKGQHVNAQGEMQWTEGGRTLMRGSQGSHWEATSDSKGGLLLAWDQPAGPILSRRVGLDGETIWSAKSERLSISTSTQSYPALQPDGSGGAYVVWQEKRLPTRWVLMAQHVNTLGAPLWTSEGTRVSLRPSDQRRPRAVYDGVAGVVIAWQDFREDASQLQAQRLNYQGNRLWGDQGIVVTAPAGDPSKAPFLASVGGGSAVFAWQAPSAGADRIFLQLGTPSGKFGWKEPGIELTAGTWHEWNPVLHGDGEGGVWIGWEDFRDNTNWAIYVKHVLVNGLSGWPTNESAVTVPSQSGQGHIGITDDGIKGIIVGWVENRSGQNGVYLQQINDKGQALLGVDGAMVATRLRKPEAPQITYLSPGHIAVCWADMTGKATGSLFWKVLDLAALLPPPSKVVP